MKLNFEVLLAPILILHLIFMFLKDWTIKEIFLDYLIYFIIHFFLLLICEFNFFEIE